MTRLLWAVGSFILLTVPGFQPHPFAMKMAGYAFADSFKVKPGAWEMTRTTRLTEAPIPPSATARMPPQFEESLRAHAAKPKIQVSRDCLTKQNLDQHRWITEDPENEERQCKIKVISKSSNSLELDRRCPPPRSSKAQITVKALTPESIEGSFDVSYGGTDKVHVDIKGHWLSPSCPEQDQSE